MRPSWFLNEKAVSPNGRRNTTKMNEQQLLIMRLKCHVRVGGSEEVSLTPRIGKVLECEQSPTNLAPKESL
jgi:hypothetical protein